MSQPEGRRDAATVQRPEETPAASTQDSPSRTLAGWRSRRAWLTLIAVALMALVVDVGTKYLAFARIADAPVTLDKDAVSAKIDAGAPLNHVEPLEEWRRAGAPEELWRPLLPPHDDVVVLPYVLEFKLVLNAGAVFGAGQGKRWLFIAFTFAALGFCVYLFASWTRSGEWLTHGALGLVMGGGLGNLYDRVRYACVRDFLHPLPDVMWPFGWSPFGSRELWPYVSNVADALLLLGIGVLVLKLWFVPHAKDDGEGEAGGGANTDGGGAAAPAEGPSEPR